MTRHYLLKRLLLPEKRAKVYLERLTEPLHLNLLSIPVALFGSFRTKVNFDLVVRQHYAFSILHAADTAVRHGVSEITVIEFGVAHGAGLLNMCGIAEKVSKITRVRINVVGFDRCVGMPPPIDYRDHPERFREGDFRMANIEKLEKSLPPSARLVVGDIDQTVGTFLDELPETAPIGFIAIDVDYYSSAKQSLEILKGEWQKYLPTVTLYLDDIDGEYSNPWCGELLAVKEFNSENKMRKISPYNLLTTQRIFKNALWLKKVFTTHILDHVERSNLRRADTIPFDSYTRLAE